MRFDVGSVQLKDLLVELDGFSPIGIKSALDSLSFEGFELL